MRILTCCDVKLNYFLHILFLYKSNIKSRKVFVIFVINSDVCTTNLFLDVTLKNETNKIHYSVGNLCQNSMISSIIIDYFIVRI